jgi:hypothetical protein
MIFRDIGLRNWLVICSVVTEDSPSRTRGYGSFDEGAEPTAPIPAQPTGAEQQADAESTPAGGDPAGGHGAPFPGATVDRSESVTPGDVNVPPSAQNGVTPPASAPSGSSPAAPAYAQAGNSDASQQIPAQPSYGHSFPAVPGASTPDQGAVVAYPQPMPEQQPMPHPQQPTTQPQPQQQPVPQQPVPQQPVPPHPVTPTGVNPHATYPDPTSAFPASGAPSSGAPSSAFPASGVPVSGTPATSPVSGNPATGSPAYGPFQSDNYSWDSAPASPPPYEFSSFSGRRIEPSPPPDRSRLVMGLIAGLVAGLLVFGVGGFFAGRATGGKAAPKVTATATASPAAGKLGVFEQSQLTLNQPHFAGTGLVTISQGWLPYLSSCSRSGEPGGPALNPGEKARVRCTLDGMSAIFVEYDSIAARDKARVKTLSQNVDARTLTPGVGAAAQRSTPSGRITGNYVEYAYKLTEGGVTRPVAAVWWDDAQTPVAGYLLAYWKEGLGESWDPIRDLWARYA